MASAAFVRELNKELKKVDASYSSLRAKEVAANEDCSDTSDGKDVLSTVSDVTDEAAIVVSQHKLKANNELKKLQKDVKKGHISYSAKDCRSALDRALKPVFLALDQEKSFINARFRLQKG